MTVGPSVEEEVEVDADMEVVEEVESLEVPDEEKDHSAPSLTLAPTPAPAPAQLPGPPLRQSSTQTVSTGAADSVGVHVGAQSLTPAPLAGAVPDASAAGPAAFVPRSSVLGVARGVCPVSDPPVCLPAAARAEGERRPSLRSQHGLAVVEVGSGGNFTSSLRVQDVAVWSQPSSDGRDQRKSTREGASATSGAEAAAFPSPYRPAVTPPPSSADGFRPSSGTMGEWRTQSREGLLTGMHQDVGFDAIPEHESLSSGAVGLAAGPGDEPSTRPLSRHSAGVQVAMDADRGVGVQTVEDRGTQASLEALPAYLDVPYERDAAGEGGRRRGTAVAAYAAEGGTLPHSGSSVLDLPTILSREDVKEIARAVVRDASSQWQLHAARHTERALARSLPQVEERVTAAAQRAAAAEAATAREPAEQAAQEVASLRQEVEEAGRRLGAVEGEVTKWADAARAQSVPLPPAGGGERDVESLDAREAHDTYEGAPAAARPATQPQMQPPPPSLAVTSATLGKLAEQMSFLGGGGRTARWEGWRSSPSPHGPRSATPGRKQHRLHSSGRASRSGLPSSRGGQATSSAQSVWDAAPFIGMGEDHAFAEETASEGEGGEEEGDRGARAGAAGVDPPAEGEGGERDSGEPIDAEAARAMQVAIEDKLVALASQVRTRALSPRAVTL